MTSRILKQSQQKFERERHCFVLPLCALAMWGDNGVRCLLASVLKARPSLGREEQWRSLVLGYFHDDLHQAWRQLIAALVVVAPTCTVIHVSSWTIRNVGGGVGRAEAPVCRGVCVCAVRTSVHSLIEPLVGLILMRLLWLVRDCFR